MCDRIVGNRLIDLIGLINVTTVTGTMHYTAPMLVDKKPYGTGWAQER
ncbi:MAG: hypothetical protein GY702_15230 [Desulfobulbaceae bacterium]|nr:hypothetical protein [Desulfobulbaceae bacterium]